MAKIAGFKARIRVDNAVVYDGATFEIDDNAETGDVTGFEGVLTPGGEAIFAEKVATKASCRVTVTNATFNTTANPFVAPLNLTRGRTITLEIFPDKNDETVVHDFPELILTNVRASGDVSGLQPVSFTGESNGSYTLAGEE